MLYETADACEIKNNYCIFDAEDLENYLNL